MNSRIISKIIAPITCLLIAAMPLTASAVAPAMAAPSGLGLLEIKITGSEFILLQNNGATITDLSSYWLTAYNNVNPLAAGVSSSTQQLPVASLKTGQSLLLSSDGAATCGASVAGKLSLSLGDSGGFLQLSQNSLNDKGAIVQSVADLVSWSSGANGQIQNIPSSIKAPRGAYYRYRKGDGFAWQQADVDATNSCQLNIVVAGDLGSSSAVTPLNLVATSPPATILGASADAQLSNVTTGHLPDSDVGLNAPQLSELLPNPAGTNNDNTAEFIELYNPNASPFDLTGFTLLSGKSTTHKYVFPAGTFIAANSFKAFYASQTKLTMSNASGQVSLLDPLGNVISATMAYEKAKDGFAWAIAKGTWYYTTKPSPDAANIIIQPVTKTKAAAAHSAKSKHAKAAKAKKSKRSKKTADAARTSSFMADEPTSHVHGWVLALVAAAALLYGAYEYRRDLANRIYWLRTKLGLGRRAGKKPAGPGSD